MGIFTWSPVVASFVTGWRVREHQLLLGSSLFVPATIFVMAGNAIQIYRGKYSDFLDPKMMKILLFITLIWT